MELQYFLDQIHDERDYPVEILSQNHLPGYFNAPDEFK